MYRLKAGVESFQVVDGEFAYHTFRKDEVYDRVPQEEAGKFEEIGKAEFRGQTPEVGKETKAASMPSASWLDDEEKGGTE